MYIFYYYVIMYGYKYLISHHCWVGINIVGSFLKKKKHTKLNIKKGEVVIKTY